MFVPSDLHGVPNHLAVFLAHPQKRCMQHPHCCELGALHSVQALVQRVDRLVHLLEGPGFGAGELTDWRLSFDYLDTHQEGGGS
jgi:hypothetical protein